MLPKIKKVGYLFRETAKIFAKNNPLLLSAAISFYVILSLGPILAIIIFTVGLIFGQRAVEGEIVESIRNFVGQQPAEVIQTIIKKAYEIPSKTLTILSSVPLLFFGGTMIFYQIRNALNIIWEVENKKTEGLKNRIKNYGFSFIMLLVVGFILVILILKSPLINLFEDFLKQYTNIPSGLVDIIDFLINFITITFLFAMIYIFLTDASIRFPDVLIGAAVTSFLFTIVQFFIGINFEKTNIGSAIGAIGSFTILFLWVFYSSLVFLFGASFTFVYVKKA